jgi:hypothetical protein
VTHGVDCSTKLTALSTIIGMVYNAIKLFMEMNPEVFAAVQEQYKEQRRL